jgi:hypothetical protein
MNNTENIEKDSETGPVVNADSVTNLKNATQEAIDNENANSNSTVIETKDSTKVIGSNSADSEDSVNPSAKPVIIKSVGGKKKVVKLTPH